MTLHLRTLVFLSFLSQLCALCDLRFDASTLQSQVYDRSYPAVVIFHDGNNELVDSLEVFAGKLESSGICMGFLDCKENKANTKACQNARLAQIPSISLFVKPPQPNPYTKKNFREFIIFQGSADEKGLEKFIVKNIPHSVKVMKSVEGIGSAGLPQAVLLSSKSTISLPYRSISFYFNETIRFYQISLDDSDLVRFGVSETPALVMVNGETISQFSGDLKSHSEMKEWMSTFGKSVDSVDLTPSSPSSSQPRLSSDVLDGLFAGTDPASDMAWVVAVTDSPTSPAPWLPELLKKCVGVVRCGVFSCDGESASHPVCSLSDTLRPFALSLPFGASSKKKGLSSLSKWVSAGEMGGAEGAGALAIKKALDSLPESSVPVLSELDLENILAAAKKDGTVPILALSNKASPSPLIRNVALALKDIAKIGLITNPSPAFLQRFGSPPVPTFLGLVNLKGEENLQVMMYDPSMLGPFSFQSIMTFIAAAARENGAGAPSSSSEQPDRSTSASSSAPPASLATVTTRAEWDALCGETFKGFCAIAFTGAPRGADASDDAALQIFQAAMKDMTRSSLFNFVTVDASCQTSLAAGFDVTGGSTPALAVYSPLKNRSAKFIGSFSQTSLKAYLEGMAAGRVNTFELSQRPLFDDTIDCSLSQREDDAGDFDADDFLAEMQREEQEKAAALKKAVEEERAQAEKMKKAEEDKKKKKQKKKKSTKKDSNEL